MRRAIALLAVIWSAFGGRAEGQLFLVDDSSTPHVEVSWPTREGETRLVADLPYRSVGERTALRGAITGYVALGGIRLSRGLGHPQGLIVRVGLAKEDPNVPFFEGMVSGGSVVVSLSGLRFTRPAVPRPETTVQEIGYGTDPSLCGLPGQPEAMYNTYSRSETLRGKLTPGNSRLGILDGTTPGGGHVEFGEDAEGRMWMVAEIPYALLRHVNDPWLRTDPGTFNEPNHFHIEFEVLPRDVAAGAEPLHRADAGPGWFGRDEETLRRGRFLYLNHACWACHGWEGKGDGPGADGLVNAAGEPIRPTDFTSGVYRTGPPPEDLYRTIANGSPGTPMIGYRSSLVRGLPTGEEDDADLRALVSYVLSLSGRTGEGP